MLNRRFTPMGRVGTVPTLLYKIPLFPYSKSGVRTVPAQPWGLTPKFSHLSLLTHPITLQAVYWYLLVLLS